MPVYNPCFPDPRSSWQVDPYNIQGNRVGTAAQHRDQREERQSLTPAPPAPRGKPPATGNILPGSHLTGPGDPNPKDCQSPSSARNIKRNDYNYNGYFWSPFALLSTLLGLCPLSVFPRPQQANVALKTCRPRLTLVAELLTWMQPGTDRNGPDDRHGVNFCRWLSALRHVRRRSLANQSLTKLQVQLTMFKNVQKKPEKQ